MSSSAEEINLQQQRFSCQLQICCGQPRSERPALDALVCELRLGPWHLICKPGACCSGSVHAPVMSTLLQYIWRQSVALSSLRCRLLELLSTAK